MARRINGRTHAVLSGQAIPRINNSPLMHLIATNSMSMADKQAECPKLTTLDLAKGATQDWTLSVDKPESIKVPAGTFEAYRVKLAPSDGEASETIWVEKSKPNRVIRWEAKTGGANSRGELLP